MDFRNTMDFQKAPVGTEVAALGITLHDARLNGVYSDLAARTVTFSFSTDLHERLSDLADTAFLLRCEAVHAVRVLFHQSQPPGPKQPMPGVSGEEVSRLVDESYVRRRWQSADWAAFEGILQGTRRVLDTQDAYLYQREEGVLLQINANILSEPTVEHQIVVDAGRLTITGNSGVAYAVADFVDLGRRYWDRFRDKQP